MFKFLSGSSRRIENFLDLDQINGEKSCAPGCHSLNEIYHERRGCASVERSVLKRNSSNIVPILSEHPKKVDSQVDGCVTREASCLSSSLRTDVSVLTSDRYASNLNTPDEEPITVHNPVDFGSLFQSGHFEVMPLNGSPGLTEVGAVDVDSNNNHCEREKPGDDDDMLGGMFAFSEEGTKTDATYVFD